MVADNTIHQQFERGYSKGVKGYDSIRPSEDRSSSMHKQHQGPLAMWTSLIAARNLASYFEEHDPRKNDDRLTLASLQDLPALRAKGVEQFDPFILSIFDDDPLTKNEYDSLRDVCEAHRQLTLLVGHKGSQTEATRLWQKFIDEIASETVSVISHRM